MYMTKIYIEGCFCLTDRRVEQSLCRVRKIGDNTDIERKDIRYSYDKNEEVVTYLLVSIEGHEPQKVRISPFETTYGERNYYMCDKCETKHTKLYLKPGGYTFLCKDCHGISYETFNPNSAQGRFLKHVKKVLKLVQKQTEMTSRIWYKEIYTERYERFLADCEKVGLTEIVRQARELEANIKAYKQKNKTNAEI